MPAATKREQTGKRLEPGDWERAALDAIATEGVASVSIPRLAQRLGVTKGSFYWHFDGLDPLLAAVLARWEAAYTDRRIAGFEAEIASPVDRLKPWSAEAEADHRAQALYLEISNAAATRPTFAAVVARVVEKRVGFLTRTYRELGFAPKSARRRAVTAYAGYVGMLHLARIAPATVGDAAERAATVREAVRLLGAR
jgi:AcrR family transcriptional regulator